MKTKRLLFFMGLFSFLPGVIQLNAQVTIGSLTPPQSFSILELISDSTVTIGGLRLPQLTETNKSLINAQLVANDKSKGLFIYNTDKKCIEYWNGTGWVTPGTGTAESTDSSWSLTGNAGTTGSNFLGTIDNNPLVFKVNSQPAGFTGFAGNSNVSFGYLSLLNPSGNLGNTAFGAQALQGNGDPITGTGNVAVGTGAMKQCTVGSNNVAIGAGALDSSQNVGDNVVAIGTKALSNNTVSYNVAIGSEAAFSNTTGTELTATGYKALYSNTTGEDNTALGYLALTSNTTGYWNVALGSGSLQNNIAGWHNTAGGNSSLFFNQNGVENTAFGYEALAGNVGKNLSDSASYNTAVGCRALWSVQRGAGVADYGYGNGSANTAVGYEAMREMTVGASNTGIGIRALAVNTTGSDNVAAGSYALATNTTGNNNVAVGDSALYSNITGDGNVAVGNEALSANNTGFYNTAVGYGADVSEDGFTNATAIGYGAIATASNQVVIGNSSVTSIKVAVLPTTISDGRVKTNIKQNVPGLDFINLLQPVTYNLNLNGTGESQQKPVYSGFIAQDVEKAAKSIGYDFSGVDVNENGRGLYGLRYEAFIVPLVKAVQELSVQKDVKNSIIVSMQHRIDQLQAGEATDETDVVSLKNQVEKLTQLINKLTKKEDGSK